MRAISSGVAARSYAASPITNRRSAVWPMYAAKLRPVPRRSTDARYSGKVEKSHGIPGRERRDVHVLDVLERAGDDARGARAASGAIEKPQLPGDDRRDAVEARRGERRVPEDLRVVVRVDVDEPGRDDVAAGVERRASPSRPVADRGDLARR